MKASLFVVILSLLGIMSPRLVFAASAKGYQLYAFPAVIVNSETTGPQGLVENPLISAEWKALYQRDLIELNQQFAKAIEDGFPGLVTPKILKEDRDRSLVVSLHIARARHYSVRKPNGTQDVYVPVTGSLYFTNPRTTEVVLALSMTAKPIQTLSQGDSAATKSLESLYRKGFDSLLAELVSQAKGRFSPSTITTTIVDTQLGLGLTSIGTRGGLSTGDKLVATTDDVPVTLISCDEDTCVAKRAVGEVTAGATYIKRSSGKLSALDKPSLYVQVRTKNPALDNVWGLVFAENLGERSPFNVVFFNPDFQYLINQISAQNQISKDDIEQRDPPELIMTISLDDPLSYKLPTNLSYKYSAGFIGRATAKIVDRNANLIFSSSSLDAIEDEITEGIDFSAEDRAEISTKNALIALAEKIAIGFKPSILSFPVSAKSGLYSTQDSGRLLRAGPKYTVYRNVELPKLAKKTLVPIGYMKAARSEREIRELSVVPPAIAPKKFEVAEGDVLVVRNVVSKALASDSLIAVCGAAENRGQFELQNVHDKVFGGISRAVSHPFIEPQALTAIEFMFKGESGFKAVERTNVEQLAPEFCVQPIQRIESGEKACKKDICQIPVSVRLGASLMRNGSSLVVKAVEQRVMTPGFNISASAEEQTSAIKVSAERAIDEAVGALTELVKPAFETAIQQQSSK